MEIKGEAHVTTGLGVPVYQTMLDLYGYMPAEGTVALSRETRELVYFNGAGWRRLPGFTPHLGYETSSDFIVEGLNNGLPPFVIATGSAPITVTVRRSTLTYTDIPGFSVAYVENRGTADVSFTADTALTGGIVTGNGTILAPGELAMVTWTQDGLTAHIYKLAGEAKLAATTDILIVPGHTFSVGDPIYKDSTGYHIADASSETTLAQGIVTKIVDANRIEVCYGGKANVPSHGLPVDTHFYLDVGGAGLTTTRPNGIVQHLFYTENNSSMIVDLEVMDLDRRQVFVGDTALAPATAGAPTTAEIQTYCQTNNIKNRIVYYTGTDVATDEATYVFSVDSTGSVIRIESPSSGGGISADPDQKLSLGSDSLPYLQTGYKTTTHSNGFTLSWDANGETVYHIYNGPPLVNIFIPVAGTLTSSTRGVTEYIYNNSSDVVNIYGTGTAVYHGPATIKPGELLEIFTISSGTDVWGTVSSSQGSASSTGSMDVGIFSKNGALDASSRVRWVTNSYSTNTMSVNPSNGFVVLPPHKRFLVMANVSPENTSSTGTGIVNLINATAGTYIGASAFVVTSGHNNGQNSRPTAFGIIDTTVQTEITLQRLGTVPTDISAVMTVVELPTSTALRTENHKYLIGTVATDQTWHDGKTIYETVIDISNYPNGSYLASAVDTLISVSGSFQSSSTGDIIALPYVTTTEYCYVKMNPTVHAPTIQVDAPKTKGHVILRFTQL